MQCGLSTLMSVRSAYVIEARVIASLRSCWSISCSVGNVGDMFSAELSLEFAVVKKMSVGDCVGESLDSC